MRQRLIRGLLALSLLALPLGMVFAATPAAPAGTTGAGANTTVANADATAAGGIFTNLTAAACNVSKGLQGPVALAIGFLVVVGGLIAFQVASRDAMHMIVRGAGGAALVVAAASIFTVVIGGTGCAT